LQGLVHDACRRRPCASAMSMAIWPGQYALGDDAGERWGSGLVEPAPPSTRQPTLPPTLQPTPCSTPISADVMACALVPARLLTGPDLRTVPGDRTGLKLRTHPAGPPTPSRTSIRRAAFRVACDGCFRPWPAGPRAVCSTAFGVDQPADAKAPAMPAEPMLRVSWIAPRAPEAARQLRSWCLAAQAPPGPG
jgi:hypothetical protein